MFILQLFCTSFIKFKKIVKNIFLQGLVNLLIWNIIKLFALLYPAA